MHRDDGHSRPGATTRSTVRPRFAGKAGDQTDVHANHRNTRRNTPGSGSHPRARHDYAPGGHRQHHPRDTRAPQPHQRAPRFVRIRPAPYPTRLHARHRSRIRDGNRHRQPAASDAAPRPACAAVPARTSGRAAATVANAARGCGRTVAGAIAGVESRPTARSQLPPRSIRARRSQPVSTPCARRAADVPRCRGRVAAPPRRKVQSAGPLPSVSRSGDRRLRRRRLRARCTRRRAWAGALEGSSPSGSRSRARAVLRRAGTGSLARARRRSIGKSRPTSCRPRSPRRHCLTAVHVCGRGDLRLALDAGPRLIHFDIDTLDLDDAAALPVSSTAAAGSCGVRSRPIGPLRAGVTVLEVAARVWCE